MVRKSLDDILDGNDEPEVIEAQETVADEQPEGQPRDESGKFASKGVEPAPEQEAVPPTADKLPKDVYEPLKAIRDENKSLKDRLEAMQQQFMAMQQPKEPPAPPPSIWEDDQAWQQHFGGQVVSQAVQQATYQSKLATSEIMARQAFDDFGDTWEPMNRWLESNPTVAQQAAADAHPWGYAYRAFKNQQTMQELGATDIETLKAKLREEMMAEMQAQKPAAIPPSLSTQRSVGARTGPAWSGPTPLSDILG